MVTNSQEPENGAPLLVITELFLPTRGGTAVWFDEVYRRIGGREIHVITAEVPGDHEHDKDHPNTIHRISLKRHWWLRPESLAMYAKLLFRGLQVISTTSARAIHAGRVLPEGLVCWILAKLFRKPLLIYAHGEEITTWTQPVKFKVMRFTYRHADRIIANSEFTANELKKIGIDERKISIISPGVDVDVFRPDLETGDLRSEINLDPQSRLILSVGRLSRRKGFDQMLRAVAQMRAEGMKVDYALIGIGEDADYLDQLAAELGIASHVHFLGHVTPRDLPRWYNACDIFAMPNREISNDVEGFGMVFIEAAACGKPAIAGDSGGTGSAVIHGVTGLRVNGESVSDITDNTRLLLDDDIFCNRLAQAGFERAVGEFSWQAVARKTVALGE